MTPLRAGSPPPSLLTKDRVLSMRLLTFAGVELLVHDVLVAVVAFVLALRQAAFCVMCSNHWSSSCRACSAVMPGWATNSCNPDGMSCSFVTCGSMTCCSCGRVSI